MKYTVSMAVDGRVDVEVEADSVDGAFEKAKEAFMDVSLGDMTDVVDARPVNVSDGVTGELLKDY